MAQVMREFTDGCTAIVRGALSAGCNFFAGCPMTPASPIVMRMLRELPARGGVAVQAEDEVAGMGMCIGAVMCGMRAFTATGGAGMSLCSESLGLALVAEIPLVIVDLQRLGPATGGVPSVGQGDVQLARWGTSGGSSLIVLSPSSIAECCAVTQRAFELSERFRCPVIVLADQELALTHNTVESAAFVHAPAPQRSPQPAPGLPWQAGGRLVEGAPPPAASSQDVLVGFRSSSLEPGILSQDPALVGALNHHLDAKIEDHVDEITMVDADLQTGARTLLLSYGITAGAMREAVRDAREQGQRISALTVHSLWPVPEAAVVRAMHDVERVVVAELNLGEYRREVERVAAGRLQVVGVNRVDGELIAPEQIAREIR